MNCALLFDPEFWSGVLQSYGLKTVRSVVMILVILALYHLVKYIGQRMIDRMIRPSGASVRLAEVTEPRVLALRSVMKSGLVFVLGFVAAIMTLQTVGINIVPLLTTASVAGLAIGFGAQRLVKDIISGFFILMEDQYGIGDRVTINTVAGEVEEVAMRITRIRAEDGGLHTFANGDIVTVCNRSRPRTDVTPEP